MEKYPKKYPIGTLARKSGVSVKTIRYYSNMGLLPPAEVTGAGYRLYSDRELLRLQQITILRFLGASLKQVKAVLAQELALPDLLTAQIAAVDAEIERWRRLRSIITRASEGLRHQEQPWHYLRNLMGVIKMTQEERAQWWGEWWRKRLADSPLPEEFVQGFVQDIQNSITAEPTEAEEDFILAAQEGRKETYVANTVERWTKAHHHMSYDEWLTRVREIFGRFRALVDAAPDDPLVQAAVEEYIRLSGPLTATTVKRLLDNINRPVIRRMAQAADLLDTTQQMERVYQLIHDALKIRLLRLSPGGIQY
ncbi:hypothetical protein MTCOM_20680 [Moorella thermoacetica]|uniref:MerR family transcriptional regulator n=1 Tax=Neomoorella thermoacetica TaxID=1525 RepID=UPI0030CFF9A4